MIITPANLQLIERFFMKDNTNRTKSSFPKVFLTSDKTNEGDVSGNAIILPCETWSSFYYSLFQLYIDELKKTDNPMCLKIEDVVSNLSKRDDLGMVLLMFIKIAPTLCDEKPINFLKIAIKKADENHDFNYLSVFMQIAAFRWANLEKAFKKTAATKIGRQGNSLIDSAENRFLGAAFGLIMKSSYFEYNVDLLNQYYLDYIIYPLAYLSYCIVTRKTNDAEDILAKYLKEISDNHPEEQVQINDCLIRLKKGKRFDKEDYFRIVKTASESKTLKKKIQDKCRGWCRAIKEENSIIWIKSINRGFYLSDIKKQYWKKLPPWPIDVFGDDTQLDASAIEAVMKESMGLS